jgi:hypothetical protein
MSDPGLLPPALARSGTIVFAVRRPSFAVLAADQQWHGFDAAGQPLTGTHPKVVLHPTLPLAFATAGFAFLPAGGVPVTRYLVEVVEDITEPGQLHPPELAQRLAGRLHPLVIQARRAPFRPEDEMKRKLDVLIALVREGQAELGRLRLDENARWEVRGEFLSAPDSLKTLYTTGRYAIDAHLYGDAISEPLALAQHLAGVIGEGIEAEAVQYGGRNRECGGGIDVILIDPTGARAVGN